MSEHIALISFRSVLETRLGKEPQYIMFIPQSWVDIIAKHSDWDKHSIQHLTELIGSAIEEKFLQKKQNPRKPTREEALEFGKEIKAKHAAEWYDWALENQFRDEHGQTLKSWKHALIYYERFWDRDFLPVWGVEV
ncbi:MAG: hypothetical protein FWF63_00705 [Fibromonadales bacterium]|nr:hypothetical protein [Fibromonadales bacterium]